MPMSNNATFWQTGFFKELYFLKTDLIQPSSMIKKHKQKHTHISRNMRKIRNVNICKECKLDEFIVHSSSKQ